VQRSYDDPATPLCDVTFCVLDLETTGGSPRADAITEIGAVKVRGGEILGTFQTLVNPGLAVPGIVTALTGITEPMLAPAPPVHQVLPALGEFVGGAVLVGHNVRFDASFLDTALVAHGRPRLGIHRVDTAGLARRLLRDDDVPDCKLGTLAERFQLDHRPCHRALDDALATVDLLHLLFERAAALGVSALDDLLTLPSMVGHPHAAKLRLTAGLPRQPGVFLFRDPQGRPLYGGRATDLRSRVRSLFASPDGRTIGPLLRTAHSLDHAGCSSGLEAGVLEARLLGQLAPRYNRQGTRWRSYRYVKLTNERFPRLAVVRAPRRDGALYLGPFVSAGAAQTVIDAVETVLPLPRRPDSPVRPGSRRAPSPPAESGPAPGPGPGRVGEDDDGRVVEAIVRGLTDRPDELLGPLRCLLDRLRAAGRHDDAAIVLDRRTTLARALRRQRRFDALLRAGRMVVDLPGGGGAELVRGCLLRTWVPGGDTTGHPAPLPGAERFGLDPVEVPPADGPVPRELADELHHVAAWLDHHADRVRLVEVEGTFACPVPPPAAEAGHSTPRSLPVAAVAAAAAEGPAVPSPPSHGLAAV
jgi:DNA polymerase-3 subunit epsilon